MRIKYFLDLADTIMCDGRVLNRVVAAKSFGKIRKGQKGGYMCPTSSLSHEGNCWIYRNAKVLGGVRITGNCEVRGGKISQSTLETDIIVEGSKSSIYNCALIGMMTIAYSTLNSVNAMCRCLFVKNSKLTKVSISGEKTTRILSSV
jgi:hypothetical protein